MTQGSISSIKNARQKASQSSKTAALRENIFYPISCHWLLSIPLKISGNQRRSVFRGFKKRQHEMG